MKLPLRLAPLMLLALVSADRCIFEGATLRNQAGKTVQCSDLAGKAVALYFAGE